MKIRMNNNHRTNEEFENFLKNIGGIKISHKPHLQPITERRYFGIGNGWLGILQRLFETLIALGWDKSFINVKEKFGGMSIFLDNLPENGFHFAIESEKETFTVCEVCGENGKQHKIKNWVHTLCDEHRDEKLFVDYNGKTYVTKLMEPIMKGDYYYNAQTHEVLICDTDNFFNPWCLKCEEKSKI